MIEAKRRDPPKTSGASVERPSPQRSNAGALYQDAARFVGWLERQVVDAARGDGCDRLEVEPSGRFWLGRLAPEAAVVALGLGERGERIDPCAIAIRVRAATVGPWRCAVHVSCCAWVRSAGTGWAKTEPVREVVEVVLPAQGERTFGREILEGALMQSCRVAGLSAELRIGVGADVTGSPEVTFSLVNTSPEDHPTLADTNLYECSMSVVDFPSRPFLLEALPDSFRYDRRVAAYGINCGVAVDSKGALTTTDTISAERGRPTYWCVSDEQPDMRFETLAKEPLGTCAALARSLRRWGEATWSEAALHGRAEQEGWSPEMRAEAQDAARQFEAECERVDAGVHLLESDENVRRAFALMNEAFIHSAQGRYEGWRPFQLGFMLANLGSILDTSGDRGFAEIIWFSTGGGKTETYLGLIVTAALHERLTDRTSGITAWSRFPLRMLSLQQTQRFADAMAGAEIVRRRHALGGDAFSVGFLVGQGATPNSIKEDARDNDPADPDDPDMPARFKVLLACPFCHGTRIKMAFNRTLWKLEHQCESEGCPWPEAGLPFYVVDDEIYRFLPTVVVGTIDKAASIAFQASMRGLVGAPRGRCSRPGHGYVYAPRSTRPRGCLVPGCPGEVLPLEMDARRYGPSFRLQDEIHLLKDSLGAVDAHYESLLDHLQQTTSGTRPKILASSATLTGYRKQVQVLYGRQGRAFPVPGPSAHEGFWQTETDRLMRRFVALAPRGATLDFAVDRLLTELQRGIRRLIAAPAEVCAEAGINPAHAFDLVSLYGTNVVYGNTLRDIEASSRSLETQVPVDGSLNAAALTGRTAFDEVRVILERLREPEPDFQDRLHVITASSMMSHGVDIDRLNAMVMLGLPLTTAEFIQTTARVGRTWPGLVFVMHKISRERDAGVFRSFEQFVRQGDRFVEPIPITRRSRRVLERTLPGLALARVLAIHEPKSKEALTRVDRLRQFFVDNNIEAKDEIEAVIETLGLEGARDEGITRDVARWFEAFFRNLSDPGGTFVTPSDLCPGPRPMMSLRDVEEQAPIYGLVDR